MHSATACLLRMRVPDPLQWNGLSTDTSVSLCHSHAQGLPQNVGLNLEVKMAVPETVAVTPAEEVSEPLLSCIRSQCLRFSLCL